MEALNRKIICKWGILQLAIISKGQLEQPALGELAKKKIVTTPGTIQRLHSTRHPFSIESVIDPRDF